jgi:hypothetical protein
MFTRATQREEMRVVFLEYAWDMAWCDPCAADPLSADELRELGVFWVEAGAGGPGRPVPMQRPAPQNVFLSRLHLRYDAQHFPEDLVFQQTADRDSFQGRYILRHPWTGKSTCPAARAYRAEQRGAREREAQSLAALTGWDIAKIRARMKIAAVAAKEERSWWESLWGD